MRRRDVLAAPTAVALTLACLAATPAAGQTDRTIRICLLLSAYLAEGSEGFADEMGRLGYREGHNLVLDWRRVVSPERNAALAAELLALHPDALIAAGTQQVEALQAATGEIPIVFANTGDPVGQGLVASLTRPGANVTGIANYIPELSAKRLELIREVVPDARRIAVLLNPENPVSVGAARGIEDAARGITVIPVGVRSGAEIPDALRRIVDEGAAALIGTGDVSVAAHNAAIIAFANERRLPTMFLSPRDAHEGGLMAYGVQGSDAYRRAAQLVDKILKGAKPRDLPVEQPTRFELVINLKTAKALGIGIPPALLARADEVLE
jgi:putative ABC transport system substrate-binding protein